MTRQEKINKVSRFCAANICLHCKAAQTCKDTGYRTTWGQTQECILDKMLAAIDAADKPATPPASDPVTHPSHYTAGGIECIDAIESMFQPYPDSIDAALSFLIAKYLWRHPFEDAPVQDLKRARFYLDRLIGYIERGEEDSPHG